MPSFIHSFTLLDCFPAGRWANLDVAVKIMLFQNTPSSGISTPPHQGPPRGCADGEPKAGAHQRRGSSQQEDPARQKVLREAAVCCSMSHPNVVATYNYKVLQASAFHQCPSGLNITDKSDSKAFKLYLIQVRLQGTYRGERPVRQAGS